MIMTALEHVSEPADQTPTPLRLLAAAGMRRGALVLHLPQRRRANVLSDLVSGADVSDANIEAFVAELRALGGMAVSA